jgi:hypothetical protein
VVKKKAAIMKAIAAVFSLDSSKWPPEKWNRYSILAAHNPPHNQESTA